MLIDVKRFGTAKALVAGIFLALVVVALIVGNMVRGNDQTKAADSTTAGQGASTAATPGTVTPSAKPGTPTEEIPADEEDPYAKLGADGEKFDNLDVAAAVKVSRPIAFAFAREFLSYTYRTDDMLTRVKPYTDPTHMRSLTEAYAPAKPGQSNENSVYRNEIVNAKRDARATVTNIVYTDRTNDNGVQIEFLTTIRIDNRERSGPWRELLTGDYVVAVLQTKHGWRVSSINPAG